MDEYAIFVWPSYAAVVVTMAAVGFISWKNKNRSEKKLADLQSKFDNINKQD